VSGPCKRSRSLKAVEGNGYRLGCRIHHEREKAGPTEEDTMTAHLAEKTCTPCRGGIPPLTRDEAENLRAEAPEWQLLDEARRLERSFRFRNFREALTFVQQVGELAEAEGHHPDITFGWGFATVSLRTKKIKGLHENDFVMAAKIDRVAAQAA
jgi:4a-hydroxytetrahydrobiopterin dehydratase